MIALVAAWRDKRFVKSAILPNILAGLIVGVVALPLAMAFAIGSGARPENGLYTAIVAGLIVASFGGSPVQIAGPTGAFIVILSGITAKYGFAGLETATLMAGIILIVMGVLRLGAIIAFIPAPVIVGFTTGIGVVIWISEWKDFFGLPPLHEPNVLATLWALIRSLPHLQLAPTGIAVASLAILIFAPRVRGLSRVPSPLIALVLATLAEAIFHFPGVATIGSSFGAIPQQFPHLSLPPFNTHIIVELLGPAFTIALLCAIESLMSAVVADGMANIKHDSNQELIGQGLANIVAPLFGGFAATGALARTATSVRNGGTNPIAGITHAVVLILTVIFLAPLAANVPLAVLAAILFVVAYNMSDIAHFSYMVRRAPRADVAILFITFFLTVFTTLVIAVNVGIVLATIQFLRRMADSVDVRTMSETDIRAELPASIPALPPGVVVYAIEGPVFFAAAHNFIKALIDTNLSPTTAVIRLRYVPFIDITGLQSLDEVLRTLEKRHVRVIICEANERVTGKIIRAGITDRLDPADVTRTFASAIARTLKSGSTEGKTEAERTIA